MQRPASYALLSLFLAGPPAAAIGAGLALSDGQFWVGVASSQDLDVAIGIADLYSNQNSRVVVASNGWYAVVLGPVASKSLSEFRSSFQGWPALPSDALFSRGKGYLSTAWRVPPSSIAAESEYSTTATATLSADGLSVTVRAKPAGEDEAAIHIEGRARGAVAFDLNSAPDAASNSGFNAYLVRLDPSTPFPQVVATRYTGGAHCCTNTTIATELANSEWTLVRGQELDGGGYSFRDIDGDGIAELLAVDNTFLYAFNSYAGSFAPEKIYRLSGVQLVDVTTDPPFHRRLVQDLAGLEFLARQDPSLWHANGFLAAWVASKARLGQVSDAWDKMIPLYDHSSDFGEMICTSGGPFDKCPSADVRALPFPLSLARHLAKNGYGPLPPSLQEVDPNLISANFERPRPSSYAPPTAQQPVVPAEPRSTAANSGGQEGTGFFVATGVLVTNAHVVEGCTNVTVSVGGNPSQGTVIARDVTNDLAAVRTRATAPAVAKLRSGSRLGEEVSVFGFPLNGLLATSGNFTRGNITATAGLGDDSRFFQISDPVQPGNSGGPLVDDSGNVVGVVTAKLNALRLAAVTADVAQNINFAIKASAVMNFLDANSIPFQTGEAEEALAAPDVAALAQDFTVIIACSP